MVFYEVFILWILIDRETEGKGELIDAFAGCQIISLIFHVFRVVVSTFRHLMLSYVHASVKPCTYP